MSQSIPVHVTLTRRQYTALIALGIVPSIFAWAIRGEHLFRQRTGGPFVIYPNALVLGTTAAAGGSGGKSSPSTGSTVAAAPCVGDPLQICVEELPDNKVKIMVNDRTDYTDGGTKKAPKGVLRLTRRWRGKYLRGPWNLLGEPVDGELGGEITNTRRLLGNAPRNVRYEFVAQRYQWVRGELTPMGDPTIFKYP